MSDQEQSKPTRWFLVRGEGFQFVVANPTKERQELWSRRGLEVEVCHIITNKDLQSYVNEIMKQNGQQLEDIVELSLKVGREGDDGRYLESLQEM